MTSDVVNTGARVADCIDIKAVLRRLAGSWQKPQPLGEDSWVIDGIGRRIIVSVDLDSDPDAVWLHASIGYRMENRIPSYSDLKMLHTGVFADGHAYQCFVPPDEHINIKSNVLHL